MTAQLLRPDWATVPGADDDTGSSAGIRAFVLPEVTDLGDGPPVVHDPAWETGYRDGHVQGRREGHEEGRLEGQALGRTEAAAAAQRAIAGLQSQLELLAHDQAARLEQLESQVVTLALELAEMVVGHHVAASADPGGEALTRALGAVRPTGRVLARVNPEDLELMGDPPAGVRLELIADGALRRGDCVLDTGASTIDATLDGAMARLRQVLTGHDDEVEL